MTEIPEHLRKRAEEAKAKAAAKAAGDAPAEAPAEAPAAAAPSAGDSRIPAHLLERAYLVFFHVNHHRFDDRRPEPGSHRRPPNSLLQTHIRFILRWNVASRSKLIPRGQD